MRGQGDHLEVTSSLRQGQGPQKQSSHREEREKQGLETRRNGSKEERQ